MTQPRLSVNTDQMLSMIGELNIKLRLLEGENFRLQAELEALQKSGDNGAEEDAWKRTEQVTAPSS